MHITFITHAHLMVHTFAVLVSLYIALFMHGVTSPTAGLHDQYHVHFDWTIPHPA